MSGIAFTKATKREAKLRLALFGPAGSGKTYTALSIAQRLGDRVAVMDTEHGSASKYADVFSFDAVEPDNFSPQVYIDTIRAAEAAGYDVLVIDSLSHAWIGKGGALELVDAASKRSSGNSFAGWKDVTPLHNRMIDAMLGAKLHLVVTMRSKTEYVIEQGSNGKSTPKKVGLAPVQRDGMEYEFDIVGDLNTENELVISKSRCPALTGQVIQKPGAELAAAIQGWLSGQPERESTPEQSAELVRLGEQIGDEATKYVEKLLSGPLTYADAHKALTSMRKRAEKAAAV